MGPSPLLTSSDSVLQGALVEDVGGERAERRVHAVLHLQTDGPDAQNHQTLKQGLGQACFGRLLTHDHRAQLAVVSHKNELRTGGGRDLNSTVLVRMKTTSTTTQRRFSGVHHRLSDTEKMFCGLCLEQARISVVVYLFGPQHHRDHALGLRGLCALVDQDGAELHLGQAGVPGAHTGAADHISILWRQEGWWSEGGLEPCGE